MADIFDNLCCVTTSIVYEGSALSPSLPKSDVICTRNHSYKLDPLYHTMIVIHRVEVAIAQGRKKSNALQEQTPFAHVCSVCFRFDTFIMHLGCFNFHGRLCSSTAPAATGRDNARPAAQQRTGPRLLERMYCPRHSTLRSESSTPRPSSPGDVRRDY